MTRVIVWGAAATAVEVLALLFVVHTLLHHAMTARGLPAWRVSDTLLTSPVLWLGAAVLAASLNRLVAAAALRGARAEGGGAEGVAAAVAAALVGAAMGWFGLRAVGKLY